MRKDNTHLMQHIIKIAKGILIGLGMILPGISGAMIATSLFVYEALIEALNNITKKPFKAILSIWQYLLGALIGIGIGMMLVQTFLDRILVPMTFLFVGFILGGIPKMIKDAGVGQQSKQHIAVFVVFFVIMISTLWLPERSQTTQGFMLYIILIVVGILTAISMIIPGLSGATILLALGYYDLLIDTGSGLISGVFGFDFNEISAYVPMFLLILVGVIVGLVFIGKLIYYLLKNHIRYFYFGVLGIVLASPINIVVILNEQTVSGLLNISWYVWLLSVMALAMGYYLTDQLIKISKKSSQKEQSHD
jgi:putative membrane protein